MEIQEGNRSPMRVISKKASAIEVTRFGKRDLNDLSFNPQSLKEWVYREGEKWVAN